MIFYMVAVIDCDTKVVNRFDERFEAVDQLGVICSEVVHLEGL